MLRSRLCIGGATLSPNGRSPLAVFSILDLSTGFGRGAWSAERSSFSSQRNLNDDELNAISSSDNERSRQEKRATVSSSRQEILDKFFTSTNRASSSMNNVSRNTKPRQHNSDRGRSPHRTSLKHTSSDDSSVNTNARKAQFNQIMSKFFVDRPAPNSSPQGKSSPRHNLKQKPSSTRQWDPRSRNPTSNTAVNESPLDLLKSRFLPASERQQQAQPQQRQGRRQNQPHTNNRSKRKSSVSEGLASEGEGEPVSSLTDFIRSIQQNYAEEQAKQKESNELDLTSIEPTPLPKWRLQNSNSNQTPRDRRRREHSSRDGGYRSRRIAFLEDSKPKDTPVHVDPKQQLVKLPIHPLSIAELSLLFREKTYVIRRTLKSLGEYPSDMLHEADESVMIDVETMEMVALELGVNFEKSDKQATPTGDAELLLKRRALSEEGISEEIDYDSLPPRPPVVCIMGHVDHGKTTLMDTLRRRAQQGSIGSKKKKAKKGKEKEKADRTSGDVAGTEAGGITQVISAFQVPLEESDKRLVTFLDTPGHAAFKAMRRSGSDAADIIVLVVAADDGVSKQTVEIIDFYKSIVKGSGGGGISLVVAMNKIDKPGINLEEARFRVESQLFEHGISVEGSASSQDSEFGTPVQLVPVSGLTGEGLDDLIEGLLLQSEVMDLRADNTAQAEGIVMDARVDKGLGIVADCIIRWGRIQKGDVVVSGTNTGKVRILKDVHDKQVKEGLPSQPVRIVGFDTVPTAGEPIKCVSSEQVAEELISRRKANMSVDSDTATPSTIELELQSSGKHMMNYEWKEALERKYGMDGEDEENTPVRIPVVVKADADGTLAAIRDSLVGVGMESKHNIIIDPVKVAVGPVLATEVQMARDCNASIICFNVKNEHSIVSMANDEGVTILRNDIIYALLDEAKEAFATYLPPVPVEVVHGRGKVQAVYEIGGANNKIAGLNVIEGALFREKAKVQSGHLRCDYRVIRNGEILSTKALQVTSMKHFKEDVDEVPRGKDCGLSLDGYDDYEEDDIIECFSTEMKRVTI